MSPKANASAPLYLVLLLLLGLKYSETQDWSHYLPHLFKPRAQLPERFPLPCCDFGSYYYCLLAFNFGVALEHSTRGTCEY